MPRPAGASPGRWQRSGDGVCRSRPTWLRPITLGGHRLSSLYRTAKDTAPRLIGRYRPIILAKILPPEAPAGAVRAGPAAGRGT
jgi:hypothetical protein